MEVNNFLRLIDSLKKSIASIQKQSLISIEEHKCKQKELENSEHELICSLIEVSDRFDVLKPIFEQHIKETDCSPRLKRALKSCLQIQVLVDQKLFDFSIKNIDLHSEQIAPIGQVSVENVVHTNDKNQDGKIAKIFRSGYFRNDQVFKKALVSLWKFNEQ